MKWKTSRTKDKHIDDSVKGNKKLLSSKVILVKGKRKKKHEGHSERGEKDSKSSYTKGHKTSANKTVPRQYTKKIQNYEGGERARVHCPEMTTPEEENHARWKATHPPPQNKKNMLKVILCILQQHCKRHAHRVNCLPECLRKKSTREKTNKPQRSTFQSLHKTNIKESITYEKFKAYPTVESWNTISTEDQSNFRIQSSQQNFQYWPIQTHQQGRNPFTVFVLSFFAFAASLTNDQPKTKPKKFS